ncbi:MAG TPA: phosphoribosylformylglycinamidine synthase subunit PurL [Acidimicrobiia bacterium]|nr:phosphoribosylformylglycinamidine synthase subunit PurL [Acidimicrobiia bacterium]
MVEQALHRALGLTDEELATIKRILEREPNELELAMYAVMWSEHCSYKSSKRYLGRFPTEAPWVLVGPGEGAGVIDVGDGLAVAVRIESHNHPSAVEPYQGAATGVGGIIRDVFSMGARPIALMDPLRFGPLEDARTRYLFDGVVAGISGYGNAVGVPTVGGEVVFDECYTENPLVNVLCLGVLPVERLVLAKAEGEGNLAVLLGSATGRDGIGGASVLASAGFEEGSEAKRPSVQVGDPFEEKRCIEACLELLDAGLAIGVQDLGAAGISCAASETAAKTGAGMDVDLARIAKREPGMNAVEVMTSESQERMLAIVTPENLDAVLALCARWEIRASVIGRVTDSARFRVYDGRFDAIGVPGANPTPPRGDAPTLGSSDTAPVADVPVESLGDGPVYDRPVAAPEQLAALRADDPAIALADRFPKDTDLSDELLALLAVPTIADKSWVYRQYDHQLFLNTVVGPGGDATVLRLPGTTRALALVTDGKARFCALDPSVGAQLAVVEAARNLACVGASPRALVNCLNFGNPEHPDVMWQFAEAVDGMSAACRALGIPVIGGNVSFYNESRGRDIDPTPVVGVVGVIDSLTDVPPPAALVPGHTIVLLGTTHAEVGGSEWATRHGLRAGTPPSVDLDAAIALHGLVTTLVGDRVVGGVHDCSDGGLAVAVAEMAIAGDTGAALTLEADALAWFSESTSRVVLSVATDRLSTVLDRAAAAGVPAEVIGTAGGVRFVAPGAFDVDIAEVAAAWREAIPRALGNEPAPV